VIFLIQYDRRLGEIKRFEAFAESERTTAAKLRLEIELELNRNRIHDEVVLLDAASEEALRLTHRRYFENPRQIVKSTG
jgi:hypothetical protein